jgi:hypothetical protein
MNYKQIFQARENRKTRLARPFKNFFEMFDQCTKAGESILKDGATYEFTHLLERSVVISTVTAIEVYYRDMFDYIFRYCSPAFFEPKLKLLHSEKYDIQDLLSVYQNKIHPLELVTAAQSFQNVDRIEKVFSKFLDKGLWASVMSLQVRPTDNPDNVAKWNNDDFSGLKAIFELRHELVHDPARRLFLTEDVVVKLWQSAHMVFGSDFVLCEMLKENMDPTILDEKNI